MRKLIATILLTLICSASYAQNKIQIGEAGEFTTFFYPKTGMSENDENGYLTLQFIVEAVYQKTGETRKYRTSVRIEDCKREFGYLYFRDFDKHFLSKSEWNSGNSTGIDEMATIFCDIAKKNRFY